MATYAIVKTGGKQYKVAVGDVVKVEKIESEPGSSVSLPVALVVDGANVTSDAGALAGVAVTGEVLEHTKGPKIRIHKFRNKTGYHKRQGHRQQLTVLKVTASSSKGDRHGTQEGRVQLAQRSRFGRSAARRQAVRRPGRQGRRDHRPAARHQVPRRRQRRARWRRHTVRQGGRRRRVRDQARSQDRQ